MLQMQAVEKGFADNVVLTDLTFQIEPQQVFGLLGPNGSGKTTTIDLICRRLKPDRGQILMAGRPIAEIPRDWIGVASQETTLYRSLTCRENLQFFARIYGLSREKQRKQVQYCLQAVDLIEYADQIVARLSGGLQRRLHVAIALIHQPRLLILDEPTTGLDIEARYRIWELISSLGSHVMVLLTTHLFEEAERVCDRIGILHRGRLVAEGSLQQLEEHLPAKHIVTLESAEIDRLLICARTLGYPVRHRGRTLILEFSEPQDLRQIMNQFPGISVDSIARSKGRLEDIYRHLTQDRS